MFVQLIVKSATRNRFAIIFRLDFRQNVNITNFALKLSDLETLTFDLQNGQFKVICKYANRQSVYDAKACSSRNRFNSYLITYFITLYHNLVGIIR